MKKFLKILGAAAVIVLGVIAVIYLQFRFDRSDIEHAVQAVRVTRPEGAQGPTIEEMIGARYGVTVPQVQWFSQIQSKTQGVVRVQARVPGSPEELAWEVDLVRFRVSPVTPSAKALGKEPKGAAGIP